MTGARLAMGSRPRRSITVAGCSMMYCVMQCRNGSVCVARCTFGRSGVIGRSCCENRKHFVMIPTYSESSLIQNGLVPLIKGCGNQMAIASNLMTSLPYLSTLISKGNLPMYFPCPELQHRGLQKSCENIPEKRLRIGTLSVASKYLV